MHTLEQLRRGDLVGATRLDLSESLMEFPREIFELADTLEILNLSGNALAELPADLSRLRRLRILFCSDNQFTEVPEALGKCSELQMVGFKANQIRTLPATALPPRLRWLILTDNQLTALPPEIGRCHELQKLMLAGNQLTHLPPEMAACIALELLRISANHLGELPTWLLSLPRLSWLAFAGNPLSEYIEAAALAAHPIPEISWEKLAIQQQLGEGASGVIYRAEWQDPAAHEPVAVKLFKGAVTSDGLPHSEMVACISAGRHPGLIPVLGKLSRHPAAAEGLVLELLDPAYRVLAGPPSFSTCTRDVYAPGSLFSLEQVLRIAHDVASAARHLHAQGLLHGDLYAHNTLVNAAGKALLSDFGAASFFDKQDNARAEALQQLEVRAFGCLLEELLTRCQSEPADAATAESLWALQRLCAQPMVAARPLFIEIVQLITGLQG
ncbi:leucine-rich repeat-containing serine/threonine-protein kinase [Hymenobacter sp. J193]|uniref:leucine-rich repeat-containing protein kinase family protein n=1 Tax=Hymenobacter sp. J193 TaxID=2898429 RepID=UPI002151F5FB|nr:leucine-rich repeat-containing protein kinase family protein [Hymenobacter sp. J193]MCR5886594.1 leucine-rich repeat-containing serine/threonine-protein kinase [Hymenobacter sp. J193]